ncbi:hypothetical protein [Thalassoroseus pseudoceratinae]|uniref:hypothetical protein n=1 Tax=Thalassoroseus pseudoceratinae TaxID=2713176 RepID=UPI00141DDCEE|nr:hypothetical protein [Thalassoroseus pseudoceratinae]
MNLRQTVPTLLLLVGCLVVAGCGGEESGAVVQQPPVGANSGGTAEPSGHEPGMPGEHGEMHGEMNGEHSEMVAVDDAGMPVDYSLPSGEHVEASHGEASHSEVALPEESLAHSEDPDGFIPPEEMPNPERGHGGPGEETVIPMPGAEEFAHVEAGHGEGNAANPMRLPPGEGPPGEHGELPMPGLPEGAGGEGEIAGEPGAGGNGLGGNARPKTPEEAARMVPQVPDDTPEYPVVELIRNILASNEEEIPTYIYPLRPKGLVGELFAEKTRADAIEEGQEMLMALLPNGRRTVGRDIWITLSNPDTGKLLTFVVRQYRGKYAVYDLNVRDNPNHRPSNNANNAEGGADGERGAGGEGGF